MNSRHVFGVLSATWIITSHVQFNSELIKILWDLLDTHICKCHKDYASCELLSLIWFLLNQSGSPGERQTDRKNIDRPHPTNTTALQYSVKSKQTTTNPSRLGLRKTSCPSSESMSYCNNVKSRPLHGCSLCTLPHNPLAVKPIWPVLLSSLVTENYNIFSPLCILFARFGYWPRSCSICMLAQPEPQPLVLSRRKLSNCTQKSRSSKPSLSQNILILSPQ